MYYQRGDGKAWFGPTKVFAHEEGTVFILQNGDLVKVNPCRMMLYEKRRVPEERDDVEKEERKSEKEPGVPKPSTESCEGEPEEDLEEVSEEKDEEDAIASRTRSHRILSVNESLDEEEKMEEKRKDLRTDCVAAYYCGI